jgi:hypothetical protein
VFNSFLAWLEATRAATAISESSWLFPGIEVIHVLAITLVVGSITIVDLRLLSLSWREKPAGEVIEEVLPWTWVSFGVAVLSGSLLFSSAATKYWGTLPFRIKMALLTLAGINMLSFHASPVYRRLNDWGRRGETPRAAKLAGAISLVLWIGVVASGRWIGFV